MFNLRKDENFSDFPEEVSSESKYITRFFGYFLLAYVLSYIIVIACATYISAFEFSDKVNRIVGLTVSQLMMPLIYLLTKIFTKNLNSAGHPVMSKMSLKSFGKILTVAVFILAVGSLLASYAIELVSMLRGDAPENYVAQVVEEMSLWEILIFVVILAPVFEELVFRKLMIDKLSKYGTSFCVIVSAFVFGLIHANFYQFFYAFGLGALMGFVYCAYGRIIYPILIHVFINAIGSIVPVLLVDMQATGLLLPQKIYLFFYVFMMISGGVVLFKNAPKINAYKTGGVLMNPSKSLLKSWGFILCVLIFATDLILNTI